MSKITNDDLTWSGTGCLYGNSGRQRVKSRWGSGSAGPGRALAAKTTGHMWSSGKASGCMDDGGLIVSLICSKISHFEQ